MRSAGDDVDDGPVSASAIGEDAGFTHVKLMVVLGVLFIVVATLGVTSALPGSIPRRLVHDVRNEQCRKGPANHGTVALGDSITRMNSDPGWDFLGTGSWFAIDACDGRMHYGYNAGVSGNTTSQMLARFHVDVADHHPDMVIILGGTNDILQNIPEADTISNLRALIRASHAIGAQVAICSVPPIDAREFRHKVAPLNVSIAALATVTDSTLINFHAVVADGNQYRSGWTADGVHPTLVAAEAMAKAAAAGVASKR
ncbi:MAG TPA: GDSL-type esterase/lipase family protein [Acidimicrobiales bacterium]